MSGNNSPHHGFHGPKCWVLTTIVGLILGVILSFLAPASYEVPKHQPEVVQSPEDHGNAEDQPLDAGFVNEHLPDPVALVDASEEGSPPILPQQDHAEQPDNSTHDSANADHNDPTHSDTDSNHTGDGHAEGARNSHDTYGPEPTIHLWMTIPFAILLLSIALMPFVNERFWHAHYPDFALLLGGITTAYYFIAFGEAGYLHGQSYGGYKMMHAGIEYYAFIALIGGLYVASGGVHVDIRGQGGPIINTALLAVGAVAANIMGTTGASVLLIQPFMRINKGRLKPIHVVMFIFIVSNCGGALTPIGDPPLYLGYLKGVPFEWTLIHLWPMWAVCIGMLLAIFFAIDTWIAKKHPFQMEEGAEIERTSVRISGTSGMIALGLIILGVFIDPMLKKYAGIVGYPVGATFQILVATGAYFVANKEIHKANTFNFEPVKEVGLLFVGIFATMAPALGFLATHGSALGLNTPSAYYFGTGFLSGVLDNAPTYLNFLQVSFGDQKINADSVEVFLATESGTQTLTAISLGAVFFGAMTYIGNGPNFMVRAIAESNGLKMPSFFGFLIRAIIILLPILVVIWAIFIR